MARSGYSITTQGEVSLSASTAKTVLAIQANSNFGIDLKKIRLGFNGTTASAVPVLVELCACTFATTGTSSSATVRQLYGRLANTGFTGTRDYSAEPTILTVLDEWLLTPNGGLALVDIPLGDTPDSPLGEGFALRLTAPAGVGMRGALWFERC